MSGPVGKLQRYPVSLACFIEDATAVGFEERTWNGWACPLFDKEGADALVAAWNAAGAIADNAGARAYYDAATDRYCFFQPDDNDEPDDFPSDVVNGVKVWAIGAGCWTWQRPERLMIRLNGKEWEVRDLEDASATLQKWRDDHDLGASDFQRGTGDVTDEHGEVVAHVSYNGRIWPGAR